MIEKNIVYNMDCVEGLKTLPDNCIDCCVTSPPYYALRDYGVDGQIGLEVAMTLDRNYIGFELNPEYCKIINAKTREIQKELFT